MMTWHQEVTYSRCKQQVRESPAATKRSFLERKGLTVAEIEEAFKRVPETSTTLQSPAQIGNTGLVTYQPQPGASSSSQQQTQPQQPQHASQVQQGQGQGAIVQAKPVPPQPEPMRWTQASTCTQHAFAWHACIAHVA